MSKAPKTDAERLADTLAEIARLEAVAAKHKATIRAKEARTRQRRAFLLGDCLLSQETVPEPVLRDLGRMLDGFLKRPADREVMTDWLAGIGNQSPQAPDDTRHAFVTEAAALANPDTASGEVTEDNGAAVAA